MPKTRNSPRRPHLDRGSGTHGRAVYKRPCGSWGILAHCRFFVVISPTGLAAPVSRLRCRYRRSNVCATPVPLPRQAPLHRVSKRYVSRVCRFVYFLAENGVIPASAPPAVRSAHATPSRQFLEWLRHHRGLPSAQLNFGATFLEDCCWHFGGDAEDRRWCFGSAAIVIGSRLSRQYRCAEQRPLRGYLQFFGDAGSRRRSPYQAVPTVPHWRLSTSAALPADGRC